MLSTLPSSTLIDVRGNPLFAPLPPTDADPKQEYTAARGGTDSQFSFASTTAQFERLYGSVDDLDIRLGWREKEQMDNDSHCGAALDTIMLGATARPMGVIPAEKNCYTSDGDDALAIEVAEFLRRCLKYLTYSHRDPALTAFQLGRIALKIGHSKAEIAKRLVIGGIDDHRWVIDRIKAKSRQNSCFIVDRQNNIERVAGYTGNYADYRDPYANANAYGYMSAAQLGPGWKLLDRTKWLIMTNRPGEDDSPLGTSAYRRAYVYYRMKRDAWAFYMKSLDQTALPFTHIDIPHGSQQMFLPNPDGTPNIDGGLKPAVHAVYEWAKIARQAGILVTQAGANGDTKVEYLHASTSGDPFSTARSVFNGEITMAILLQMLATTDSRHMARAAGEVHQDILDLAMRQARRMLCDAWTRDVFVPLVKDNFPVRYHHLIPTCSFGEVELNDFAAWAEAFAKLATAGLLHPSQFPAIWGVLGLPQADMKEFYKDLGFDKLIEQQLLVPENESALGSGATPATATDGATGATASPAAAAPAKPSLAVKYTIEELGKRLTRDQGQRRVSREGVLKN